MARLAPRARCRCSATREARPVFLPYLFPVLRLFDKLRRPGHDNPAPGRSSGRAVGGGVVGLSPRSVLPSQPRRPAPCLLALPPDLTWSRFLPLQAP